MSMPIFPVGKSRTCPKEDSTIKPLPRNLEIVLALVGDSTITREDIMSLMIQQISQKVKLCCKKNKKHPHCSDSKVFRVKALEGVFSLRCLFGLRATDVTLEVDEVK